MVWNNVYLGTPRGTTQPSGHTAAFSDVSISGTLDADIAQFTDAVTMDSTLAVTGAVTLSAALNSASAISGGALAGTTGNFGSTLSVRGATTLHDALNSASAISGGAVSATSGTFSGRVSVGGGVPITFVSASSSSLVATTVTASTSVTTQITNNNAAIGDIVTWGLGTSTSSLSQGVAMDLYVSAASSIQVRLSNVSTANAAQAAISLTYKLERLVW